MRYNAMGEQMHPSDAEEAGYLRLRRRYWFIVGLYLATGFTFLFVAAALIIGDVWNPDWLQLLVVTAVVVWVVGLLTHIWFAYVNSPITYDDANQAAVRFARRHGSPPKVEIHGDWAMGQTQTWTWTHTWQLRHTDAGYELYRLDGLTQEWRWEGTLRSSASALEAAAGIEYRSQGGRLPAQAGLAIDSVKPAKRPHQRRPW